MKQNKKFIGLFSFVLMVVAVVFLFVKPAMNYEIASITREVDSPAVNVILNIEGDIQDFNFDEFDIKEVNVLGGLALVFLVVGGLLSLFRLGKFLDLIVAVLLIIGGIFIFIFPATIDNFFTMMGDFTVAWPLIITGVLGILAGVINLFKAAI